MADLRAVPQPAPRPGAAEETEAMLRIANAIAAELPAVTSPHWHRALTEIRRGLSEAAGHRASGPSLA